MNIQFNVIFWREDAGSCVERFFTDSLTFYIMLDKLVRLLKSGMMTMIITVTSFAPVVPQGSTSVKYNLLWKQIIQKQKFYVCSCGL